VRQSILAVLETVKHKTVIPAFSPVILSFVILAQARIQVTDCPSQQLLTAQITFLYLPEF
jgi:hypothetical protein